MIGYVKLSAATTHHLSSTLRLHSGDLITLQLSFEPSPSSMGSKSVITQVLTRQGRLARKTKANNAQLYRNGLNRNRLKRTASFLLWGGLLGSAIAFTGTTYLRYQQQFLTPSVALVLGGAPERERFAAKFAKENPSVEIWVSSGSNPEYAQWVFEEAHIPTDQWQLDYEAVDTVTNFTTLVDKLEAKNVDEVYLLTSDYHMRRASVVAQIVLGSRGIEFKPVEIPTEQKPERPETVMREVRDGARSILWVVTGKTGSELKESLREKS